MQTGAGTASLLDDEAYAAAAVTLVDGPSLFGESDIVCKVQPPTLEEAGLLREGSALVSFLQPAADLDLIRAFVGRRISAFSLDLLPRISRSQSMDALSSQALVSGYRAALLGAEHLPKFFPLYMTAAGTVPPAKVLVLGAGVAGLQAIATARRLGAVVRAFDVRPAATRRGEEPRCELRRARARDAGRRRRLRARAVRGLPAPPAGADRKGGRRGRRRDHDCGRPGPQGAGPRDRRDGPRDGARAASSSTSPPRREATSSSAGPARTSTSAASPSSG